MLVGQHLDLASPVPVAVPPAISPQQRTESERYLGVRFDCCGAYSRIYRTRAGDAFVGHCPKCARRVQFKIGPEGTDSRFFCVE
ncbi:MAG: hypothetical protein KF847_05310 [Pirellulales bacterium]|nr:hypothetical protein [Pirellulales bacterium]